MRVYIAFLLAVFLIGGFAPRFVAAHPRFLLAACILVGLSFSSLLVIR